MLEVPIPLPRIVELETGQSCDFHTLWKRVGQKIHTLQKLGLMRGERVALVHGNSIEFFCDLLAVWKLRACAVVLHPKTTPSELERILKQTNCRWVISRQPWPNLAGATILHTTESFSSSSTDAIRLSWPQETDECLILFSSGSSGEPKGVRHHWRGLTQRIQYIQSQFAAQRPRKTLCFLPTSFGHGLIGNCLAPWWAGSELVLQKDFGPLSAPSFADQIRDEKIDFFSSVPTVWKLLQHCQPPGELPELRRVHCASAPLDVLTQAYIRDWCGPNVEIRNIYGLSELASWVGGSPIAGPLPHNGFIGQVWGAEVRLWVDDQLLQPMGREGEICLKSQGLMAGYVGESSPALVDGFFKTGDLGWLDEHQNLTLTGRLSDHINVGGNKISPLEVRLCLESHPSVEQAWVGALADDVWGQSVASVVIPKTGFSLPELRKWLARQLTPIKQPSVWLVLETLPRNNNGKPDRAEIVRLLQNSVAQRSAAIHSE